MQDLAELKKVDALRTESFADKSDLGGNDALLDQVQTPMPPPGTPHPEPNEPSEQNQPNFVSPSLSMPTLPILHSISDARLVNQYRQERTANPVSFDRKTHEISERLLRAKIRRGGANRLSQGDYTVELASREDATQADDWEHNKRGAILGTAEDAVMLLPRTSTPGLENKKAPDTDKEQRPRIAYLSKHVSKYTTSGSLEQQCTRTVEEGTSGRSSTFETTIKIKQNVFVPHTDSADTTWEDVLEAEKEGRLWRAEQAGDNLDEDSLVDPTKALNKLISAAQELRTASCRQASET